MSILKVKNLSYGYSQEKDIIKNIDLNVAPGEAVVILGQNGSGKTTLLKLLMGSLKPTSGQIFFQERPLEKVSSEEINSQIGYVSQGTEEEHIPATVYDHMAAKLQSMGLDSTQIEFRVKKALDMVQMWEQRFKSIAQLSYGQRKRIALAMALALEPKILIIDEPSANLDPRGWTKIIKELKKLRTLGMTFIIATNDVDWIPTFADKILVLHRGEIATAGTSEEVFRQPQLLRQWNLRLPRIAHLFEILQKRERWLCNSLPLTIGQAYEYLVKYRSHEGKLWRKGYTTGACAAAAAKAAVSVLVNNEFPQKVEIVTPLNTILSIPIHAINQEKDRVTCSVIKDGGDDPDITHGLEIKVTAQLTRSEGKIEILGGTGVGRVTKAGLAVAPGEPAINPIPQKMIREAVRSLLPPGQGVKLEVSVPAGEKVAGKTLNPQLGIVGGISILGTTGIVEPMSEEAFKSSLVPQISMALAQGHKTIIMTPGRMGQQNAKERWGLPDEMVIQMSNFVGYMLQQCSQHGVPNLILYGHIGKLIKVAGGIFHTHSKVADGRREILAAHASIHGASPQLVQMILQANTMEEAVELIKKEKMEFLFDLLASQVSAKASQYVEGKIRIGTVLTSLNGEILGKDSQAEALLEELR